MKKKKGKNVNRIEFVNELFEIYPSSNEKKQNGRKQQMLLMLRYLEIDSKVNIKYEALLHQISCEWEKDSCPSSSWIKGAAMRFAEKLDKKIQPFKISRITQDSLYIKFLNNDGKILPYEYECAKEGETLLECEKCYREFERCLLIDRGNCSIPCANRVSLEAQLLENYENKEMAAA